jgi:hypothetical protein
MSVRGKVALELGTIAVLTTVFLVVFPKRSPAVDVALVGFALVCSTFYYGIFGHDLAAEWRALLP